MFRNETRLYYFSEYNSFSTSETIRESTRCSEELNNDYETELSSRRSVIFFFTSGVSEGTDGVGLCRVICKWIYVFTRGDT